MWRHNSPAKLRSFRAIQEPFKGHLEPFQFAGVARVSIMISDACSQNEGSGCDTPLPPHLFLGCAAVWQAVYLPLNEGFESLEKLR